jgi:hypothetical protein
MSEITPTEYTCTNCNQTFTKNFCNGCGQKKVSRITNAHLVHEVMHVALHADKGIFPFMKRLVLSPGIIAREFIEGKRKIFNPLQFLVLSVGFVIVLMSLTHFYESIEILHAESLREAPPEMKASQEKLKGFMLFIQKNSNFIILVLLPIFAFFGKVLFKKQQHNYAEHLMIAVFAMCLSNVLTGVMLVFSYFFAFGIPTILASTVVFSTVSLWFTYKQFYQMNWFTAFWKSISVYLLTMLIYIVIIAIITVFIVALSMK